MLEAAAYSSTSKAYTRENTITPVQARKATPRTVEPSGVDRQPSAFFQANDGRRRVREFLDVGLGVRDDPDVSSTAVA